MFFHHMCSHAFICLVESFVGKLSVHQLLFAWTEPKLSFSPTISLSLSIIVPCFWSFWHFMSVFSKYLTVERLWASSASLPSILQHQSNLQALLYISRWATSIIELVSGHQDLVTASKKICLAIEPRGCS